VSNVEDGNYSIEGIKTEEGQKGVRRNEEINPPINAPLQILI
jgi:hypothetical protein